MAHRCMQMDITYDAFIRTTDAKHEGVVRAILDRVWERGDIYKAKYEGAAVLPRHAGSWATRESRGLWPHPGSLRLRTTRSGGGGRWGGRRDINLI